MAAWVCLGTKCGVAWPEEFTDLRENLMRGKQRFCRLCGAALVLRVTSQPLSASQAKHLLFDKFWVEWEAKRVQAQSLELASLPESA